MSFKKGNKINSGRVPWNKGIPRTKEVLDKMKFFKKGNIPWNKNINIRYCVCGKRLKRGNKIKYCSRECYLKYRPIWNKGKHFTEKQRKNISLGLRKSNKFYNTINSKEYKKKISESRKGNKNPRWNGGTSYFPYSLEWTEQLRISIRERDDYTCQMCWKKQGDKAFSVHHIDYDKKNCNPENLITLCKICHSKTNKNRNYWEVYFKNIKNI